MSYLPLYRLACTEHASLILTATCGCQAISGCTDSTVKIWDTKLSQCQASL